MTLCCSLNLCCCWCWSWLWDKMNLFVLHTLGIRVATNEQNSGSCAIRAEFSLVCVCVCSLHTAKRKENEKPVFWAVVIVIAASYYCCCFLSSFVFVAKKGLTVFRRIDRDGSSSDFKMKQSNVEKRVGMQHSTAYTQFKIKPQHLIWILASSWHIWWDSMRCDAIRFESIRSKISDDELKQKPQP